MTAPTAETQRPPDPPVGVGQIPVLLFIRGLSFVLVMVGVVLALHYYLGVRLIRGAQLPELWNTVGWAALWTAFATIPGGLLLSRLLRGRVAIAIQWFGFIWMGAFGVMLSATALSDLIFWAMGGSHGQLQAWVVLGVTVPALVFGFYVARGTPQLVKISVPVKGLGKGLDGFRIVQLTDIHIGDTLGRAFAQRVVDQVNALNADMVAITGDAIDGSVVALRDEVAPFAQLSSTHGTFYVTGNHEYYHGGSAWEAEAARLGMTVLHNAHRVIEKDGAQLVVGGVTDLEGGRFSDYHRPDAVAAFAKAPAGVPRILLAHQPRFARLAKDEQVSLQLSGHTHGGQMFPFMFFVRLQQPVIAGFKLLWGVPVYTSRGTGYWGPPFRIGPSSEITEITLRAA